MRLDEQAYHCEVPRKGQNSRLDSDSPKADGLTVGGLRVGNNTEKSAEVIVVKLEGSYHPPGLAKDGLPFFSKLSWEPGN